MENIEYNRCQLRYQSFAKSFSQLKSACEKEEYSDLERAGLIKSFEITWEMAWKLLKSMLFVDGIDANTPREAIQRAFQAKYITEDEAESLLDALKKRNIMSHTYDEKGAKAAEQLIKKSYFSVLFSLFNHFEEKFHHE